MEAKERARVREVAALPPIRWPHVAVDHRNPLLTVYTFGHLIIAVDRHRRVAGVAVDHAGDHLLVSK